MNARRFWFFSVTMTLLCGCGKLAVGPTASPRQPAQKENVQSDSDIPADSFRVSVRDGGSTESHIKKTVVVELPSSGTNRKVLVRAAQGEQGETLAMDFVPEERGPADANQKQLFSFTADTVQNEGEEDRSWKFLYESATEPKSDVPHESSQITAKFAIGPIKAGFGLDRFPLSKDQKLGDVFFINVEPGVYKVGASLSLGGYRLPGLPDFTFALNVVDEPPTTVGGKPLSHWIERLHSDEQRERAQACGDLGRLGTKAKVAVPVLIDCLREKELQPRWHFVNALGDIGPPAVPALIQALKDDDVLVREGVAVALGRIGPDAKAAVPALIEAHASRQGAVSQNAAEALKKIDPEAAKQAGVE